MKFLRPIVILALILLILEVIGLSNLPTAEAGDSETMNEALYKKYFITQIVVFTCSFIAFFTGLFTLIVAILKATLKENALCLSLLFISFIVPIIAYYA